MNKKCLIVLSLVFVLITAATPMIGQEQQDAKKYDDGFWSRLYLDLGVSAPMEFLTADFGIGLGYVHELGYVFSGDPSKKSGMFLSAGWHFSASFVMAFFNMDESSAVGESKMAVRGTLVNALAINAEFKLSKKKRFKLGLLAGVHKLSGGYYTENSSDKLDYPSAGLFGISPVVGVSMWGGDLLLTINLIPYDMSYTYLGLNYTYKFGGKLMKQ